MPSPGMMPTAMPMLSPMSSMERFSGVSTRAKPMARNCSASIDGLLGHTQQLHHQERYPGERLDADRQGDVDHAHEEKHEARSQDCGYRQDHQWSAIAGDGDKDGEKHECREEEAGIRKRQQIERNRGQRRARLHVVGAHGLSGGDVVLGTGSFKPDRDGLIWAVKQRQASDLEDTKPDRQPKDEARPSVRSETTRRLIVVELPGQKDKPVGRR